MSWFSGLLDNGVNVVVTEVRFTQGAARLNSVGCSMSAKSQQFVSKTATAHPADPVSNRSKVEWPDTELRLQGSEVLNEPIKITLTNRRKRFRTVIGTTVFTLASLNLPSKGKKPFKCTLLLETALSPSLNVKIDLNIQLQGVDSWSKLKPFFEDKAKTTLEEYPKGAVVVPDSANANDSNGSSMKSIKSPQSVNSHNPQSDSMHTDLHSRYPELGRFNSFSSRSSHHSGCESANAVQALQALAGGDVSDIETIGGSVTNLNEPPKSLSELEIEERSEREEESLGTPSVRSRSSSINKQSVDLRRDASQSHSQAQSLGSTSHEKDKSLGFSLNPETLGIVFLEIMSVANLPKFRTLTGISFDMDPFVVMSFGRKVYKTPHRRHTLNPTFNCKVAFEVMPNEKQFSVVFSVWDMDRITLNDKVAETEISVAKIMNSHAPRCDPHTHLYDLDSHVPSIMVLPLEHVAGTAELVIKAHYYPEAAIRQQMWRGVIGLYLDEPQYSAPPSTHNSISSGAVAARSNAAGSNGNNNSTNHLSDNNGNEANGANGTHGTNGKTSRSQSHSSVGSRKPSRLRGSIVGRLKIKSIVKTSKESHQEKDDDPSSSVAVEDESSEGLNFQQLKALLNSLGSTLSDESVKQYFFYKNDLDPAHDLVDEDLIVYELEDIVKRSSKERIILFRICPICHQTSEKLHGSRALFHLALCANRHWAESNSVLLDSHYVSSAQASKRWYSNFLSKFSYGSYQLGAHSANILVQDRITGQISEEKIATSVRIGIRMIYALGPVERKKFQNLLRKYTLKQGIKYSSKESASQIEPFIKYHNLDMSEVLLPVSSFTTFNDFFYRKLKPGARPCENPQESRTAVSAADCRVTIFPSVSNATELWIKGKSFSIQRLLGDAYPEDVYRYTGMGSSIAIFRLAPQDYHRVHSPIDGIMGKPVHIDGNYYTVNPMAVRSNLDVFGENARTVFPIQSPVFGKVMIVMVGAMMVGSCITTAQPGSFVRRTDELGYFRFGGSTVVVLFERQKLIPDSDLLANSLLRIESLVKVGMSVGHAPGVPEYSRSYDTRHTTIKRAKSLISGGGAYLPFALD